MLPKGFQDTDCSAVTFQDYGPHVCHLSQPTAGFRGPFSERFGWHRCVVVAQMRQVIGVQDRHAVGLRVPFQPPGWNGAAVAPVFHWQPTLRQHRLAPGV